ncbi:MAG: hypothetical protein IBX48_07840 [Thiomicrospira sp.]|uniref:hypothetical protein n=1 Tax=Thiomicrospira sp. TaxID=935 RepID=UPI001A0276D3|nr:hypothetical protein [Thiomicrospira sp.]MBE0494240.1 hypothetical protein [Thiomicrospira sp.]
MKDIADDLINDLEDLESSTQELNDQVDRVVKNNSTLEKQAGETVMETAVLMLEASKMAQESAISSQESATINLKLAGQQQQQIDSMHDAGISWRQTIRDANLEIKSSRSFFIGLLTSGIILTLIAIGLMSWLVLLSKTNQAESQTKLLDMIQIEASLNQRQVNMKIDELASVVENALSYQRNGAHNIDPNASTAKPINALTEGSIDQNDKPTDIANAKLNTDQKQSVQFTEIQKTIDRSLAEYRTALSNLVNATTTSSDDTQKMNIEPLTKQLAKIENLLQAQSAQIDSINNSLKNSVKPNSTSEKSVTSVKKPTDTVATQLSEMKKQLDSLQARQDDIHTSLQKLTNEFAKAKEEAVNEGPKPYSYRNPYEYKQ